MLFWGALAGALLVAQQVMAKATRDAFFLSQFSAAALPPVMIGSAILAVAAAFGTSRLLAGRPPRQAVPALVGANAALLLGWFLLAAPAPGLAAVLVYLHVAATGSTLVSGYWSVVNERFDPWTAKRAVSRLAVGTSVGGVAGGLVAFASAGAVPLATMLVLTAALNVLALLCLVRFAGPSPGPSEGTGSATPVRLSSLRAAPYLRVIALLVALGAGAEALLDYVLKSRAAASLASGHELMLFFAAFHTGVGVLALLGQTLLTPAALRRLGLAGTVALRPALVSVASALALVDARLWSAVLSRGSHDVLSNSLFRSGYELLYTPLPESTKRAAKQLVDVGCDKLGALVGAAATLAAVRLLDAPDRALVFLAAGIGVISLGLTGRLHRGYVAALEESLRAGRVRLEAGQVMDSTTRFTLARMQQAEAVLESTPAAPDPLLQRIAELRSGQPARIHRALADPEALEAGSVPYLVPLLARNDVYHDVLRCLRKLAPRATGQLVDVLLDPEADPGVRRRLPRVLKAAPSPRVVTALLQGIEDPAFEIRESCAAALAAVVLRSPELTPRSEPIFAAVRRELQAADAGAFEQVFRLLSLVLDRRPLRVAAAALRGSDAGLKGTALEYMENVLPLDLHAAFFRFVGAQKAARARGREELLTELLGSRPRD